jgi:RNA polymerase sigma-70 factor (ECF subfamily)
MDIIEIIQEARHGDIGAFERLFELKKARVFGLAYRILGNAEDARDVSQLVFIRLWKELRKYDPAQPFDSWLYRIVVNLSIDYRRSRSGKKTRDVRVEAIEKWSVAAEPRRGPEKEQLLGEVETIFLKLADGLSPAQRTAFILKEIENLSTGEIAEIMGCTESTVRNHLFQGRKILQEGLKRLYPEYLPRKKREET